MVDRVSDMIARIRNSQARGRLEVTVLGSRLCEQILDCLVKSGYIRGYVVEGRNIQVLLKYKNGFPVIRSMKRLSRPGFRVYKSSQELRRMYFMHKYVIFTSNQGVLLNSSLVFENKNTGGEPLIIIS